VSDVKLGGFEPAFLLDNDDGPSGHVSYEGWRSPETQVQSGNSTASEMFSLGLMVTKNPSIFVKTIADVDIIMKFLHILGRSTLWQADPLSIEFDPPTETLIRQFILFGPVPEELLECISYELGNWPTWYRNMTKLADKFVEEFPKERFAAVAESHGIPAGAVELLQGMVELAPSRRCTTEAVLGHGVWKGSWRVVGDE
jgi:hypothetical protein